MKSNHDEGRSLRVGSSAAATHAFRSLPMAVRHATLAISIAALFLFLGCARTSDLRSAKIGLIAPFSGYDANTAYSLLAAMKEAIAEADRRAPIGRSRIEVVALDDRNDPEVAAEKARELALDPAVVAVVARVGGRSGRLVEDLRNADLPTAFLGGPAAMLASGRTRLVCADATAEGRFAAEYAQRAHFSRPIAVTAVGNGFQAAGNAFVEALAAKTPADNLPIAGSEAGAATEAPSAASAVAKAGSDFVFFSGPYLEGTLFARDLSAKSAAAVLIGSDANTSSMTMLNPPRSLSYVASCSSDLYVREAPATALAGRAKAIAETVVAALPAATNTSIDARSIVWSALRQVKPAAELSVIPVGER